MLRSLYSGVSGLRTHQTKMDVIGNNIANVNTVAFKSSSVTFSDVLYQTTSGASAPTEKLGGKDPNQVGLGVMSGSTKVSIENGGSEQSTGDATDIKLTDGNATNFFIVNNGSENVFTRAGSFYFDVNGNLAMTSTGYLVQGWGADQKTQTIKRDTVSPLRIMQAANLTSSPEATTNAIATGIIDKNTPAVSSNDGYIMNLSFYDQKGYAYTAKFAVHSVDPEEGKYNVELKDILDSNSKSILDQYLAQTTDTNGNAVTHSVADIWGRATTTPKNYTLTESSAYNISGSTITITSGAFEGYTASLGTTDLTGSGTDAALTFHKPAGSTGTGADETTVSLQSMFGVSNNIAAGITTGADGNTSITLGSDGQLQATVQTPSIANDLKFSSSDGTFTYIGETGNKTAKLNLDALNSLFDNGAGPFVDIDYDFTGTKNLDNGKTSTLASTNGDTTGTIGKGKKIGKMTGVSIDQSGKIFGSYDNGNTSLLGQIAVAQFSNASGLQALGNNCYGQTLNSGEFDGIGTEVTSDGGSMTTGVLEMSNVDLSKEFTEMITTQRGFQANSRIITVSDSMLEELVNLKRS